MSRLEKIAFFSFLGLASLLSIFSIKSWDFWFHLSLGREIFGQGGIPETEIFLYPHAGQQVGVGYLEWLFAVVLYAFHYVFSLEGVILLKAAVCTFVMYVLLKHSVFLTKKYALSIAVLIPVLLVARFRFSTRPEIFLYLFMALLLYFINLYIYQGKKYLYIFPALLIIWVNMHPTGLLAFFILIVYIGLGLIQIILSKYSERRLEGVPDRGQCKTLLIILLLSLGAYFIHPFPKEQFLAPFQVGFSQIIKDEIVEMRALPWHVLLSNVRGLIFIILAASFALSWRRLNLPHLIIASVLAYGSFKIIRMHGPMTIVAGPIIAANFNNFYERYIAGKISTDKINLLKPISYGVLIALIAFFAVFIPVSKNNPLKLGLGIEANRFPEGAIQYVLKNDIRGNMMNTFHYGGYIEWRAYPTLRPFIDGRALFPEGFTEDFFQVRSSKKAFEALNEKYDLDFAIFDYPRQGHDTVSKLHSGRDKGFMSTNWALVYWDNVSLVYIARKPKFKSIIARDEYKYIMPSNDIAYIYRYARNKSFQQGFFEEIERKLAQDPESMEAKYNLAFFYMVTREYRKALEIFLVIDDNDINKLNLRYLKHQSIGESYLRLGKYSEAVASFKKALKVPGAEKQFLTHHHLAKSFFKLGKYDQALQALEKSLEYKPDFVPARKLAFEIYHSMGNEILAKEAEEKYFNAIHKSEGEKLFMKGLKHYKIRNYHQALVEFEKSIKIYPDDPNAHSYLAFAYYYLGNYDKALQEHNKTLELAPKMAGSLRGIAEILEKQDNPREALKYWKLYLKANPRGHWARKAKEHVKELKQKLN